MLAYIIFFAAVLFALTMEIYAYQEAYNNLAKALGIVAIIITSVIAIAGFTVSILIDRGVIRL